MLWFTELAGAVDLSQPQIINDSKTPSGRVHVGSLRGVLIHDAVYRVLTAAGANVRYLYGVDDYDPVDEIPFGHDEHFTRYLGAPLCNTPPPPGSSAPDMATHFIDELFGVMAELGVKTEIYRMRDIYREGRFNEPIDRILSRAAEVRAIYKEVSGSVRPDDWHPFQVLCEVCGRVGTTKVTAYDGKEVTYECLPNLVKWARGCGNKGKMSPFDGRGKLPWKLEWTAKWRAFGVTIEGAGKDHTTKGGARDVSNRCFEVLFGGKPPRNIPYEFFLVGGAKMSSSKGIGASAREMADFLPPEVLRFLVLNTQPKTPVNFSTDQELIVKLFNDFDRLKTRSFHDPKARAEERQLYGLCEVDAVTKAEVYDAPFQLVLALAQMPHLDLYAEIEKRKGSPLAPVERARLERRVRAVRTWLDLYAREEDKMYLQEALPARASELSQAQRAFLCGLAGALATAAWDDDALQAVLFDVARRTPLDNGAAFRALYRVLLDRAEGPRAGSLIAFLDRAFVIRRLEELDVDAAAYWRETATTPEELDQYLAANRAKTRAVDASLPQPLGGVTPVEVAVTLDDGKVFVRRVILPEGEREAFAAVLRRRHPAD
jgi:lysyl-tRNA synthetase class 1